MKKNILGSVIKDLRKNKKITQKELSALTKFSQNTISNHENGNRSLTENDINRYAVALNVSPEQLFEAVDQKYSYDNKIILTDKTQTHISNTLDILKELDVSRQQKVYSFAQHQLEEQSGDVEHQLEEQNSNIIEFPQKTYKEEIQAYLSAGTGVMNYYESDKDVVDVPEDAPEHDWIFKIIGDSMKPLFDTGDIVYVNEFDSSTESVQNGRIYVVEVDGEAYIKKVYVYEETKMLRLVSLNQDYVDLLFNFQDSYVKFIGRVII